MSLTYCTRRNAAFSPHACLHFGDASECANTMELPLQVCKKEIIKHKSQKQKHKWYQKA